MSYLPYINLFLPDSQLKAIMQNPKPHQIRNAIEELLKVSAFLQGEGIDPADVMLNPEKYQKRHKPKKISRGTR